MPSRLMAVSVSNTTARTLGVQPQRWFVGKHHLWFEHQCTCELDDPLLTAGQRPGVGVMELPDGREPLLQRQRTATNLATISKDVAAHQEVLPDGEGRKQAPVLRHMHNTRLEDLAG